MSRFASDLQRVAVRAAMAGWFAIAPSTVPSWRLSPAAPPGLVLPVGEPVRWFTSGGSYGTRP